MGKNHDKYSQELLIKSSQAIRYNSLQLVDYYSKSSDKYQLPNVMNQRFVMLIGNLAHASLEYSSISESMTDRKYDASQQRKPDFTRAFNANKARQSMGACQ